MSSRPPQFCPTCGRDLAVAGAPDRLVTTAEFAIPPPPPPAEGESDDFDDSPPTQRIVGDRAGLCSWCGRPAESVRKLLAGPGVQICDECVALCYEVLRDELPGFGGG